MLAKPQGFPRKLGGCAGLDPRLRSAVSAGVGDGERGLRRGLRAPGVGVRPKWVLEYSPSNKRIRYFVSITYVRTGLWTAHKFCGGGNFSTRCGWISKRCQTRYTIIRETCICLASVRTLHCVASAGLVFKVVSRISRSSSGVSTRRDLFRVGFAVRASTPPSSNAARAAITVGRDRPSSRAIE